MHQETGNQSMDRFTRTQMTMKVRIFLKVQPSGARTGAGGPMTRGLRKRMLRATDEVMEHRLPPSSQRTGVSWRGMDQGVTDTRGRWAGVEADTEDPPVATVLPPLSSMLHPRPHPTPAED